MSIQPGIPKGAAVAINDLLDHCAKIQLGQEVVLLAHVDGLYGGDNLVDQEAISWIQAAIQQSLAIIDHDQNGSIRLSVYLMLLVYLFSTACSVGGRDT